MNLMKSIKGYLSLNNSYNNFAMLPVIFVVNVMSNIFKILHMRLNNEPSQKSKIWMFRIIHLDKPPWVLSASNLFSINLINIQK